MKQPLLRLLAFVAGVFGAALPARAGEPAPVTVEVARTGQSWTADYQLPRKERAWIFRHSSLARATKKPWRPGTWTVETPGVKIERHGWRDVLLADGDRPVPSRVRVRFTPFSGGVISAYPPALEFTDGSVALFSDEFDLLPIASPAAAAALPVHLDYSKIEDLPTRATFRDPSGQVLARGERHSSVTYQNGRTYILYGKAGTIIGKDITTVVDPQLPAWLLGELNSIAPRLLGFYAGALGPRTGPKPMLMVSWAGATPGRRSMGGSTLPALIVMRFEGEVVTQPSRETLDAARWFIAHEAAHFWLGETIRTEAARDSWIMEGGADLLAVRAIAALDPGYNAKAMLQSLLDECITLSAGRSIETAAERSEQRAFYACGAMFALAAESVTRRASGGDYFRFCKALIEANAKDEVITKHEWLAEVTRLSKDPRLAEQMRAMIETGVADPAATLAALFDKSGVAYSRSADGKLLIA